MLFDPLGGCQLKVELNEIDIDVAGFIGWRKGRVCQVVELSDHG